MLFCPSAYNNLLAYMMPVLYRDVQRQNTAFKAHKRCGKARQESVAVHAVKTEALLFDCDGESVHISTDLASRPSPFLHTCQELWKIAKHHGEMHSAWNVRLLAGTSVAYLPYVNQSSNRLRISTCYAILELLDTGAVVTQQLL